MQHIEQESPLWLSSISSSTPSQCFRKNNWFYFSAFLPDTIIMDFASLNHSALPGNFPALPPRSPQFPQLFHPAQANFLNPLGSHL